METRPRIFSRACNALACAAMLAACGATKSDVVERCVEAKAKAKRVEPREGYDVFVRDCHLLIVKEPRCRAAMEASMTADPAVKAHMVASECAEAYCPKLPEPLPGLCDDRDVSASELPSFFSELMHAVRVLELGEDEARRYLESM